METPPSLAPSDLYQLFPYLEQSSTNLDEVQPISPSRRVLLQNRLQRSPKVSTIILQPHYKANH